MKNLVLHNAIAMALLGGALAAQTVQASSYTNIASPIGPGPTLDVPAGPESHPGKEYASELNTDAGGNPSPGQTLLWDGSGGVKDGFQFSVAGRDGDTQVDAMAHTNDTLFNNVLNNTTAALFSLRDDAVFGDGRDISDPVFYETTAGDREAWATAQQVNQEFLPANLIALEVWGQEGTPDATRFSLFSDSNGDCSIYDFDGANTTCWLTDTALNSAVQPFFSNLSVAQTDLDAMMISGNTVLFSLWTQIDYDGGGSNVVGDEVFVWNRDSGAIGYFNHGGHPWDSGWTLSTFLYDGALCNEFGCNVDALEAAAGAAPEPASLSLLAAGIIGLGANIRLRRRA
jgi:hypothetical protein